MWRIASRVLIPGMGNHEPAPARRTLLVAGTFVGRPAAGVAYRRLAHTIDAEVITLDHLGLVHTRTSVGKVMRRIDALGEPVNLVGHSQGGVVAALIAQTDPQAVGTVVTLGAPLHGTVLSRTALPFAGLRCMVRDSRLCCELQPNTHMHNVVGTADHMVMPYSSGLLAAGPHHVLHKIGHLGLILDSRVVRLVDGILRAPVTVCA
jgi:hypothetical protein